MITLSEQFQDFFAAYDIVSKEKQKLIQLKANLNSTPTSDELKAITDLEQKIAKEQLLTDELLTKAKTLSASIAKYYQQTPLERYEELPKTSQFIVNGELDVLAMHKNELQVASQVKRFQEIIANQKALIPQYEKRIKKIKEEIIKTVEARLSAVDNNPYKEREENLYAERDKLTEVVARIKKLSNVGEKLASPKPISYEEMSLLHSIKNIFNIEENLPQSSAGLIERMKADINAIQQSLVQMPEMPPEDIKAETEKRLMAMQELCSYYETYSANQEEPKPLSFPGPIKIKQIRYELPQKYRNAQGGITGATVMPGISFDMPPEQNLYVPKQANVHLTFENGAHLIVTPKSELYLPSKQHFGIGDDFDEKGFQASVNLFAEQYAKIHGPINGIQRMTLNFTGVDEVTSREMKEAFIAALIEKECVKMENGKRTVDTVKLQNLYISAQNLDVKHVFENFKKAQGLPSQIFDFDRVKNRHTLNPSLKMRGDLSAEQEIKQVSELIKQSIQQFKQEIQENPDPSDLRSNNSLYYARFRSEESRLKRAICIVSSHDKYMEKSNDTEYEDAKKLIKEKLKLQHKGVANYNAENELKKFIEVRIEDRKMCQARRPGLN